MKLKQVFMTASALAVLVILLSSSYIGWSSKALNLFDRYYNAKAFPSYNFEKTLGSGQSRMNESVFDGKEEKNFQNEALITKASFLTIEKTITTSTTTTTTTPTTTTTTTTTTTVTTTTTTMTTTIMATTTLLNTKAIVPDKSLEEKSESLYVITAYRNREENKNVYIPWMQNYLTNKVKIFSHLFNTLC